MNDEINEDEYDEALQNIPSLKQQTEHIINKNPTIKNDIVKLAEQNALNKLIKGNITTDEYINIKNLYKEPINTTQNTLRKSIINPINYKVQHKK